jgi:osmotically-inducible protein OsmY
MKTDTQLQLDVIAELKWEPSILAEKIGVKVKDGVVILTGHLDSCMEKFRAEQAAMRVYGVKALTVEIDVSLTPSSRRTDADIAYAARNALDRMTSPISEKVHIEVEGGCITLSGDVDWQHQKVETAIAVRFLPGVTGVANLIDIKPTVKLNAVQSDIETALISRAKADARKMHVTVEGGMITLSGTVETWAERETARNTAWGTPGVTKVIDNLTMGS